MKSMANEIDAAAIIRTWRIYWWNTLFGITISVHDYFARLERVFTPDLPKQ